MPEEPASEENFIPPIDLQMKEPAGMDFNFDLSAIPDVSEVEEDEPIALSLDELNKIDISEENVLDYETPKTAEALASDVPVPRYRNSIRIRTTIFPSSKRKMSKFRLTN